VHRLPEKVALITGAGSGLGREGALLFAREGARVVVMDRAPGRADAVAKAIINQGGEALAFEGDVGRELDMKQAVDQTTERFGGLDIFWANAGHWMLGGAATPIEEITQEQWSDISSTNLTGVLWGCKYAVPALKRNGGGSILMTGSGSAFRAMPGTHLYAATKGAINSLAVALSRELGPSGIRVNCINPMHGMSINFMLARDAEVIGKSYEVAAEGSWDPKSFAAPLEHPFPPELIDNAWYALFLVSDEGRWISGQSLYTTDGATMNNSAMNFSDSWESELVQSAPDDQRT
jgi:NAD(P)-dependent dehydrogenase (short-subunit alcohol dehydrogenase family)